MIKECGAVPSISIKPGTDARVIFPYLKKVGMVLVMSVEPGFGGQSFMPCALGKITAIRKECDRLGLKDMKIEVDGGIGLETGKQVIEAGADVLVAGSALFGAKDPREFVKTIKSF